MAIRRQHAPVLRFAAIFSRHPVAIDWACARAAGQWGTVIHQTPDLDFNQTDFYHEAMGIGLKKRLVAFKQLIDPFELVESKLQSGRWEDEYQSVFDGPESRAVNIDPGYVSEAKVVLATMKDRDHRLYLGEGVFGEITLYFQLPGRWVPSRWTYPDYRDDDYHAFFHACRTELRNRMRHPPNENRTDA